MDSIQPADRSEKSAKGYKGLGMEGPVARWYAKNTAKTLSEFKECANEITGHLREGSRVLEVAPGPGYLAVELAKLRRYQVFGLDISKTFVQMAQENARGAGVQIDFRQGNVAVMPYENAAFDFIVCRAAFKNFADPLAALNEMHRVLKDGARALIIDLRRDAPKETIDQYVDTIGLGWWDTLITKWTFELMLKKRAYVKREIEQLVASSPFSRLAIDETGTGMNIWLDR